MLQKDRLDKLERKLDRLIEGLDFVAEQFNGQFGVGTHISRVFTEVAAKVREIDDE